MQRYNHRVNSTLLIFFVALQFPKHCWIISSSQNEKESVGSVIKLNELWNHHWDLVKVCNEYTLGELERSCSVSDLISNISCSLLPISYYFIYFFISISWLVRFELNCREIDNFLDCREIGSPSRGCICYSQGIWEGEVRTDRFPEEFRVVLHYFALILLVSNLIILRFITPPLYIFII